MAVRWSKSPHRYWNSRAIWDHSVFVTCHPSEVTFRFQPLPQPKLVLDLATPEECKAELTKAPQINHISGITEARQISYRGYIKCYETVDILPLNRRGYGHVTVFEFYRLPWCIASREFLSDSWCLWGLLCNAVFCLPTLKSPFSRETEAEITGKKLKLIARGLGFIYRRHGLAVTADRGLR